MILRSLVIIKIGMKILIFFLISISCFAQKNTDFGIAKVSSLSPKPLDVGTNAPNFIGTDQYGNTVQLADLTNDGHVLILFYRGYWCGYCQKNLVEFQESFSSLSSAGVQVIAVAPETEKNIEKTVTKGNIEFSVISDTDNSIMKSYGVAFTVTKKYQEKVTAFTNYTLNDINNQSEAILPIPAAYLIDTNGKIVFVHFDPDYSKRVTVDDILNNL